VNNLGTRGLEIYQRFKSFNEGIKEHKIKIMKILSSEVLLLYESRMSFQHFRTFKNLRRIPRRRMP